MSHERYNIAEAKAFDMVEGNMCGAANARRRRSAGVEDHITHGRNASEPGRPHSNPWPPLAASGRAGKPGGA